MAHTSRPGIGPRSPLRWPGSPVGPLALALALLVLVLLALPAPVLAQGCEDCDAIKATLRSPRDSSSGAVAEQTVIYVFWGDGCPHCEAARQFLAQLAEQNPGVVLREYEVYHVEGNLELLNGLAAKYGFEATGVPTILIGDRHWVGFTEDMAGPEIEAYVAQCAASGCADPGTGVEGLDDGGTGAGAGGAAEPAAGAAEQSGVLSLPLLGTVDLGSQSLLASTALIAFVDGFNPCSLWVLSLLLALTLHSGSRKRVLIIGLVFLTVTSLIYALFIAGLFTVFTFVSFAGWIQAVVALVALASPW